MTKLASVLAILWLVSTAGLSAAETPTARATARWTPTAPFTASRITSIAVTPAGISFVIAFSPEGVFRSADQGHTWTLVQPAPGPLKVKAFDPRSPRTLFAVRRVGFSDLLFKSTLAGRQWSQLLAPLEPRRFCTARGDDCFITMDAFAVDPQHSGTALLAGAYLAQTIPTLGLYMLHTDDGFSTWTGLAFPYQVFGHNPVTSLAIDPERRNEFYALTCGALFKSVDAGANWQAAGAGLPAELCANPGSSLLSIDRRRPDFVYVGTRGAGVYASLDRGRTFRPLNRGIEKTNIASLLIDPHDSRKLYVGIAGRGVFRWVKSNQAWVPINTGLSTADFEGVLTIDPQHSTVLYAGTRTGAVFRFATP
ncbi:MAG: hypothetical protein ABI609_12010 [Acidobacteriota bacterium]